MKQSIDSKEGYSISDPNFGGLCEATVKLTKVLDLSIGSKHKCDAHTLLNSCSWYSGYGEIGINVKKLILNNIESERWFLLWYYVVFSWIDSYLLYTVNQGKLLIWLLIDVFLSVSI